MTQPPADLKIHGHQWDQPCEPRCIDKISAELVDRALTEAMEKVQRDHTR